MYVANHDLTWNHEFPTSLSLKINTPESQNPEPAEWNSQQHCTSAGVSTILCYSWGCKHQTGDQWQKRSLELCYHVKLFKERVDWHVWIKYNGHHVEENSTSSHDCGDTTNCILSRSNFHQIGSDNVSF